MKQYVINEDRLIELLEKEDKLCLLECAGIDNWHGYDYAFKPVKIEEDKNEKNDSKINI